MRKSPHLAAEPDNRLAGQIFEYDYRTVYGYAEQIRRVLEHVRPRQRLFMVYEEFFADPATHYPRFSSSWVFLRHPRGNGRHDRR